MSNVFNVYGFSVMIANNPEIQPPFWFVSMDGWMDFNRKALWFLTLTLIDQHILSMWNKATKLIDDKTATLQLSLSTPSFALLIWSHFWPFDVAHLIFVNLGFATFIFPSCNLILIFFYRFIYNESIKSRGSYTYIGTPRTNKTKRAR